MVIDTERTDDPLTGFYHRTDWTPLTDVSLGELGVRPLQPGGDCYLDDLAAIDDYSYELRTSSDTLVLTRPAIASPGTGSSGSSGPPTAPASGSSSGPSRARGTAADPGSSTT